MVLTADRGVEHRIAPSPRQLGLFLHDPVRNHVYLVGGLGPEFCDDIACSNALIDDLWRFDPKSRRWTEIADVLLPHVGDAGALDFQSRQIVEYQPYFNNETATWAYDLEQGMWENRHPAIEPPGRWGSMMTYDSRADRVLIFGGAALTTFDPSLDINPLNDLWAYDYETNTWAERHPSVSPPPRQWGSLVYVPSLDRAYLFGGFDPSTNTLLNDTWAYDYRHNRWTNLNPAHAPAPRFNHAMAFDAATNQLVLCGGFRGVYESVDGETWIYDLARNRWTQVSPEESPGPLVGHMMNPTRGSIVLFGGGGEPPAWGNGTYFYSAHDNEWELVAGGGSAIATNRVAGQGGASAPAGAGTGGTFGRGLRSHR
jgi:N-acetylneuraminic acid mutarotase